MAYKLKIYQICYDDSTCAKCFKQAETINNNGKLSHFFENDIIKDIYLKHDYTNYDYIAIWSHAIKSKIVFKENKLTFNYENAVKVLDGTDVYSFNKRRQQSNIITQAERWHPGIVEMTKHILESIGYELPNRLDRIVLFNYWIMKTELFDQYCSEMLLPAIAVADTMPELHKDAGYKKNHKDFTKELGYNYYPYTPFIFERLMSVWLQYRKDLSFKHIF